MNPPVCKSLVILLPSSLHGTHTKALCRIRACHGQFLGKGITCRGNSEQTSNFSLQKLQHKCFIACCTCRQDRQMECMGMKHAKCDYSISQTSRWQLCADIFVVDSRLGMFSFRKCPNTLSKCCKRVKETFFYTLMISHIGILPTAGECYSLNAPLVASQGARQLLSSSHPMIFKLLPLVPQYFEESVSCTNLTKEISHTFTFKCRLLCLFWFSTSQVLHYELLSYKNCDRHMQAPAWR